MPGKYSHLRNTLPAFEEEPEYQAKVEELKTRILGAYEEVNEGNANVSRFAAMYVAQRYAKKLLEDEIYDLNVELTALAQILSAEMRERDLESLKTSDGTTVYLQDTPYPGVEDKDVLQYNWVRSEGMADMHALPWMALKGLCTERLINGEEVPPGVKVFIKTEARVRAGK